MRVIVFTVAQDDDGDGSSMIVGRDALWIRYAGKVFAEDEQY